MMAFYMQHACYVLCKRDRDGRNHTCRPKRIEVKIIAILTQRFIPLHFLLEMIEVASFSHAYIPSIALLKVNNFLVLH
jgi:hypothetical protein